MAQSKTLSQPYVSFQQSDLTQSPGWDYCLYCGTYQGQQFPTKRLNPVAGITYALEEQDGHAVPFPTKRLNPVAGISVA